MTQRDVLAKIDGLTLVDYLLVSGGDLLLYFGDVVRQSPLLTEWLLSVSSAWRVEDRERVLVGSLSESDLACRVLDTLKERTVLSVSFTDETRPLDIRVALSDGVCLLTFANSIEDDLWEVRSSTGLRVGIGAQHAAYHKQLTPSEIQELERAARQARHP
jgi:hypothetical protein